MKQLLFGCLLLASTAHGAAGVYTGQCLMLDATGFGFVSGEGRLVRPRGFASLPAIFTCEGQTEPPGFLVVYNFQTTGQTCGALMEDGSLVFSENWQETIAASGRIRVRCVVTAE